MESSREKTDTKRRILGLIIDSEANTVEILSNELKLNPSVVRRHLEDMAMTGLVSFQYEKILKGRPKKIYAITTKGRDELYGKYDVILELLVRTILKSEGADEAKRIFVESARALARESGIEGKTGDEIMKFLEGMGFEPERQPAGNGELLISHNCPMIQISMKYPELACDTFHTDFLKMMTGKPNILLTQAISRGATKCIHEIHNSRA
ncbi:MAG TPA: ArsR family transcriptional regulator [Nitrososphaerales archaeon]|nr:ArsR family transcriptional regulator [Nitrososphaerales archaeon]